MTPAWFEKDEYQSEEDDNKRRSLQLIAYASEVEFRQAAWYETNLWYSTLYNNRVLVGFRWGNDAQLETELWPTNLRTENLVQSIGDSMVSKASSSPLRPSLEPHGRSWKTERATRIVDDALYALWRALECEEKCIEAYRDAYQADIGCVHVCFDDQTKELYCDSVFFDNIVIDQRECANRAEPRTYMIRKVMPREQVTAIYGWPLNNTDTNDREQKQYLPNRTMARGWVPVVEVYRLADKNGDGGIHAVACEGYWKEEKWDHEWVPLVFFHWRDRTSGFFSQPGVEQVVPFQIRQNELNDDIKEAQAVACRPYMMMPSSTQINIDQWVNIPGNFLQYNGMKPEPLVWNTNLIELYNERERNRAAAYSFMGLSEAFANADLPNQVRMDSSAGMREFRNMEDSRHLRMWTAFEKLRKRVAEVILKMLSIHKDAKFFKSTTGVKGVNAGNNLWDAFKTLISNKYEWTMEAVPLSEMSPAARRETLRDWTSRGLISPDQAKRYETNPNLERLENLEMASADDITRHIALMENGKYERPTNLTNLTLGIKMVTANYHRLKSFDEYNETEDEVGVELRKVIDFHLQWIVTAQALVQAAAQAQMQPPQMTPFAPTQGVNGTSAATAGA